MNLQEKIQLLRKQAGLSQEEMAERLGLSRQAICKWEAGLSVPDISNLILLSDLFQISVDRLIKPNEACGLTFPVGKEAEVLSGYSIWDPVGERKLRSFLSRASKETYAGGGPKEKVSCREGSYDLRYEEGDFVFLDSYLGGEKFAGEEAIWYQGRPVWAMNYCGRVLSEEFKGEFLKEALLAATEDCPYRGPELYQKGEFTYHRDFTGDMKWFQGYETIYCRTDKVYDCYYHGGIIK